MRKRYRGDGRACQAGSAHCGRRGPSSTPRMAWVRLWLAIAIAGHSVVSAWRQRSCPRCDLLYRDVLGQALPAIRSRAADHLAGLPGRVEPHGTGLDPHGAPTTRRTARPMAEIPGLRGHGHRWHLPAAPRVSRVLPGRSMPAARDIACWRACDIAGPSVTAGALFTGVAGSVLLADLAYQDTCDLPGSAVEGEEPAMLRAAARWLKSPGWIAARAGCRRWAGRPRHRNARGLGGGARRRRATRRSC